MGPDVNAELTLMAELDADELPAHEPHFDPINFQELVTNPKIEEYRLDPEELRQWGVIVTMVRA